MPSGRAGFAHLLNPPGRAAGISPGFLFFKESRIFTVALRLAPLTLYQKQRDYPRDPGVRPGAALVPPGIAGYLLLLAF